jgi:hypothetical protein
MYGTTSGDQRIVFGQRSPSMIGGIRSARIAGTSFPSTVLSSQTYSSPRSTIASGAAPFFRRNPASACDGEPSAAKAIFFGGPLSSSRRSSCRAGRPPSRKKSRRGVASTTSVPGASDAGSIPIAA